MINPQLAQATLAGATSQQLPNLPLLSQYVATTITAPSTNTGIVYLGTSSAVTASTGFPLEKGQKVELPLTNANQLWAIGTTSDKIGIAGA